MLQCGDLQDFQLREIAVELIPICRESGTILTFDGRPDMVRELGVHGLLVDEDNNPPAARANMGPEAIIGALSQSPQKIVDYDNADIDFIVMSTQTPSRIIEEVRAAGSHIPFVAMGDFRPEDACRLRFAGYNGICTGKHIFESADPAACIRDFLKALAG